ncbi:3336_t:CDS:2 [Paraglomus brasilianum]|uniref:3336_t:CDS:1 n=1 Tax=Paraglomus brasilianum TaxID=144538 RepID=A0A9N8ZMX8_9GLOM|nr:3336_t:CDS:2 [Paraglomus brasilianum]
MTDSASTKSSLTTSQRILFSLIYRGRLPHISLFDEYHKCLSEALNILEDNGAAPVLPDGRVGGNACAVVPTSFSLSLPAALLTTKSGKLARANLLKSDIAYVNKFDTNSWQCEYYSSSENIKPTSDTSLYWACLIRAPDMFQWSEKPGFAMHGHVVGDDDICEKLGIPVSEKETRFSTREDMDAMMSLLSKWSYPQFKVFVRRGHGFFILGKDAKDVFEIYENKVKGKLTKIYFDFRPGNVELEDQGANYQ